MDQKISGDTRPAGPEATLDLTVICPFYNEEQIIEAAVVGLLERLETFEASWELVIVDDGSRDRSLELARKAAAGHPNVRVLTYPFNRGRGYALRTGISQARGEVIVTTEIDLSWGEDIVERLYAAAQAKPDADIIVASPHAPGGRYKNVPASRVFFSTFGNFVIRALMSNAVTMNTGMTRAYRRGAIRSLPLLENRKEFHLEVILKAQALGYRIEEIPATLEWKEYKLEGRRVERKSSSKVNKLVVSHSLFSLFANPMRYVWGLAGMTLVIALGFLAFGVARYFMGEVSVFMLIVSLGFGLLGLLLMVFGVIAQQGNMIQREIWTLKREIDALRDASTLDSRND